jgi:lipocalin-like protein
MRRRVVLLALGLALSAVGEARSQPASGEPARQLVGIWRYVGTWIDGKPRPNRGANPKGYIFYAASGEMAAQIAPDRVNPMVGATPTAEEAKAALADYVAYFGTWSLDERAGTVTHRRVASVQPGPLTDYVRTYEFKGDRLILRPVGTRQEVVWERMK